MCGIFSVITSSQGYLPKSAGSPSTGNLAVKEVVKELFLLSQTRGQDASGVAVVSEDEIKVLKLPIKAKHLLKTDDFSNLFRDTASIQGVIGHARMQTNGSYENPQNNQPVTCHDTVVVHNGIVANLQQLWEEKPELGPELEVDTEVIAALVRQRLEKGEDLHLASQNALSQVEGMYAIACLFSELNTLLLASNNGSLYFVELNGYVIAASERLFLKRLGEEYGLFDETSIKQAEPDKLYFVDLSTASLSVVKIGESQEQVKYPVLVQRRKISRTSLSDLNIEALRKTNLPITVPKQQAIASNLITSSGQTSALNSRIETEYQKNYGAIAKLRRCSKCVLPETMPFINFDSEGVCNFCRSYKPFEPLGVEALLDKLTSLKQKNWVADCVVPFSGGRDSSYGLHYIHEVLGLKPITFTYDWGMVTDLARRNISRICGKLHIENILISANIQQKRKNIQRNVSAWLRRPELSTIPLFMAGDKQFLYYVNKVKRDTSVNIDIWMANRLENTEFKVGFCGISPGSDESRIDALSFSAKFQMLFYYATQVMKNPAYINRSLVDTMSAFYCYYFEPRPNYHLLFDYLPWDEEEIEKTLIEDYNWETSPDTRSTWRIGDGTASFYNHIYYTMAGFTENDTFRSNQIREGMITRENALEFILEENAPRIESLKWYLETIEVPIEEAIKTIDKAPKLYPR